MDAQPQRRRRHLLRGGQRGAATRVFLARRAAAIGGQQFAVGVRQLFQTIGHEAQGGLGLLVETRGAFFVEMLESRAFALRLALAFERHHPRDAQAITPDVRGLHAGGEFRGGAVERGVRRRVGVVVAAQVEVAQQFFPQARVLAGRRVGVRVELAQKAGENLPAHGGPGRFAAGRGKFHHGLWLVEKIAAQGSNRTAFYKFIRRWQENSGATRKNLLFGREIITLDEFRNQARRAQFVARKVVLRANRRAGACRGELSRMTPDTFELLLAWLGPNRDAAATKYETIRAGLIRVFVARGCLEAEDLADETFNRVAAKAGALRDTYEGNPARYFYGVADKIHLEHQRRQRPRQALEDYPHLPAPTPADASAEQECLHRCLARLEAEEREFIVSYYSETKRAKIELHQEMAAQMGLTKQGLRSRAFRLKTTLRGCIEKCLQKS